MRKLFLCLLVLGLGSWGFADTANVGNAKEGVEYLLFLDMPTTSISKTPESIFNAPVTSYLITQEEIKAKAYLTLQDVFKHVPGIYLVELSDSEWNDTEIYVRGLYANKKLLFLVDGHKINPSTGEPFTNLKDIPLISVKQVEISFGSASSLYGADAMAGIVNIVTYSGKEMDQVKLSESYGSFATDTEQLYAGFRVTDDLAVSVSGMYFQSATEDFPKDFPDIFGSTNVDLNQNTHNVHVKADYQNLHFSYYELYKKRNNSFAYLPAPLSGYDYSGSLFWETLNQFYALDYDYKFNEQLNTKTTLTYNQTDLNSGSGYPLDPYGFDTRIDHFQWHGKSTRLTEEVLYQIQDLKWVSGVDFEYFSAVPKEPSLYLDELGGWIEKFYFNLGVFSQVEYRPLPSLSTTAGVRFDRNSLFSPVVNPRVGVNWEVAPKIHINAAWGTSYLAPAPHKIYDRYGDPSVFIGLPNENLKPERLMTYELGASLVPYSDVLVRVSGFGMDGSDLYNSIEYPQSTDPNSPAYNAVYGYSTAGNLAQMRLWGGQASAQSLVTSWLDLEADYMYVTGEQNPNVNTASETALVRMPKDLLNFRADFNFDPVRFGVSGNWFDNITTSPGNGEFFGGTYHGVWTFDGYLSYQTMIRGVETKLALTVKNMLDKQYYKISWSDDWAGVTLPELPQPRRTLLATLSFRF